MSVVFVLKGGGIIGKPYRTTDELLVILSNNKKLSLDDNTRHIIELEGYYPIINGYKDLFLIKKEPDEFMANCNFNDIYSLFLLDRELRFLMIRKLIKIEQRIKVATYRVFTNHYREAEAYLEADSYSKHNPSGRDELLIKLAERKDFCKKYLNHYKEKHGEIPLWVLANNLSFGIVKNFYLNLNHTLQDKIAKELSITIVMPNSGSKLFRNELRKIMIVASHFRNICAHDERLYNEEAIIYDMKHPVNTEKYFLYDMINLITPLLLKNEQTYLFKRFNSIINNEYKFSDETIKSKILNSMNFPIV